LLERIRKTGVYACHGKDEKLPLDKSTLHKFWRTIRSRAELGDARPHDFRHTTGTFAAQAGSNAFVIRDLLGHKTVAMTSRYVERAPDPLRATADAVANRIAVAMDGVRGEVAAVQEWQSNYSQAKRAESALAMPTIEENATKVTNPPERTLPRQSDNSGNAHASSSSS
jgi:hypothetical protein